MPNGTLIKNIPEGTSKEEIAQKFNSVFTGEKTDVAMLVLGNPGDPKSGLGSWTDAKGNEKFLTEIDDSESSIIPNSGAQFAWDSEYRKSFPSSKVEVKLNKMLKHDKLFKHSPQFKNLDVEILRYSSQNEWKNNAQAMFQYQYDKRGDLEKIIVQGDLLSKTFPTEEDFKSILIHEIQHNAEYKAVIPKKDIGQVENYSYVSDEQKKAGLVKGYQNAETYFDGEALSEGQQDNLYYDSKGIKRPMSTPQNYLVSQHIKRLSLLDPANVPGQPISMSTVPFPPHNPNEENARNNLDIFMEELAEVESRNQNVANATGESSAKGYFQFLTDTKAGQSALQTAVKRTKKYFGNRKIDWMDKVTKTGDVLGLTYEQQKLLAIGDLMEKTAIVNGKKVPGLGDQLWIRFFKAQTDKELTQVKREIYSKLHHTDTGGKNAVAIKKNMDTVWK